MSERRTTGDWVWLAAGAGATGEANRLKAEIQPEDDIDPYPCIYEACGDLKRREWCTLWTEPDPDACDRRYMLCHVSECQMHDVRQPPVAPL